MCRVFMEDGDEYKTEYQNDNWEMQLSPFEYSCYDDQETESKRIEQILAAEQDKYFAQMWTEFQRAATCVTNLYRETELDPQCWRTFQEAAERVTNMYTTFKSIVPRLATTAQQNGSALRTRELLKLLRKSPRRLKREDVVAILCNRHPKRGHRRRSPRLPDNGEPLQPFCEALDVAGLDVGMSGVALSSPKPPSLEPPHRSAPYVLDRFGKRSLSSPSDVASKRSRLA